MDPLTVVGTVASVCQLAQAALSLSKSLYALGSALSSASEDLQTLADDLSTFSQSLTLLSRMLEDGKSWYSDDIYLLTAKIIKDYAELYSKIDRILAKLGGNGKSNWKLRVKFVYKEGQIRKLLSRLRDMKGTLATILMSLQEDLQLSLLNIASSSKIQGHPVGKLQPETIECLYRARQTVEAGGFFARCTPTTDRDLPIPNHLYSHSKETGFQSSSIACHFAVPISAQALPEDQPEIGMLRSFVLAPSYPERRESPSIRSSSSIGSFKSALSVQDVDFDVARNINAMRELMYVFQTALQTLEDLIERRLAARESELYIAAQQLVNSLERGRKQIDHEHIQKYKALGENYLQAFTGTLLSCFHGFSSMVMLRIVRKLRMYADAPEELNKANVDALILYSDECSRRVVVHLDMIASSVIVKSRPQCQTSQSPITSPFWDGIPTYEIFRHDYDYSLRRWMHQGFGQARSQKLVPSSARPTPRQYIECPTVQIRHPAEASEYVLPFIGYTFKRFDNFTTCSGLDDVPFATKIAPETTTSSALSNHVSDVSETSPNLRISSGDIVYNVEDSSTSKGPKSELKDHSGIFQHTVYDALMHKESCTIDSFVFGRPDKESDSVEKIEDVPESSCRFCPLPDAPGLVETGFITQDIGNISEPASPTDYSHKSDAGSLSYSKSGDAVNPGASRESCKYANIDNHELVGATQEATPNLNIFDERGDHDSENAKVLADHQMLLLMGSNCRQRNGVALPFSGEPLESRYGIGIGAEVTTGITAAMYTPTEDYQVRHITLNSYLNSKQFDRIRKRRIARKNLKARLSKRNKAPASLCPSSFMATSTLKPEEELSWTYPALTGSQTSKIWWQAYLSLIAFSSTLSDTFKTLKDELETELEVLPTAQISDTLLAQRLSDHFAQLTSLECDEVLMPGMQEVLDMRNTVMRIVQTVDEQMGLKVAVLGWSFVWVYLTIYESIFFVHSISPTTISIAAKSFTQLQTVVAIIARYAVMENIFQQSNGSLALKSEYRISLISICSSILKYFAAAFDLGHKLARCQDKSDTFEEETRRCNELLDQIKSYDWHCQRFRVVFEANDWHGDDESETEYLSDESWEEITGVELEAETD